MTVSKWRSSLFTEQRVLGRLCLALCLIANHSFPPAGPKWVGCLQETLILLHVQRSENDSPKNSLWTPRITRHIRPSRRVSTPSREVAGGASCELRGRRPAVGQGPAPWPGQPVVPTGRGCVHRPEKPGNREAGVRC